MIKIKYSFNDQGEIFYHETDKVSKKINGPFIIYGTGQAANIVWNFFKEKGYTIVGFAETNSKKTSFMDLPVYDQNSLPNNVHIAIASSYAGDIMRILERNNDNFFNAFAPIFMLKHTDTFKAYFSNQTINLINENKDKVINFLSDEISKKTFCSACEYRINKDDRTFIVSDYHPYIHPAINFNLIDCCYDCGAFTGDTYEMFQDYGIFFNNYIAVEASEQNYNILKNKKYKITTYNYCLNCIDDGFTTFTNNGNMGDHRSINGSVKVKNISLDKLCHDAPKNPLIKMDIEGSEMDALKGSVHTIKEKRPCMIVCLYHHGTDIVEIPIFIHDLCTDYSFYIGHHWPIFFDTILYCVPNEIRN